MTLSNTSERAAAVIVISHIFFHYSSTKFITLHQLQYQDKVSGNYRDNDSFLLKT